jgi:signal transduction histidine kinase
VIFTADDNDEPKSRPAATSLFRIAQEALRNAATHGHARRARVLLTRADAIRDDGDGFNLLSARHSAGLGLMSMEERAHLLRGRMTIRSKPGRGTTIAVRVPLESVDADDGEPRQRSVHSTSAA